MTVYLFEPFYQLYRDGIITPTLIRTVLREIRDNGVEFEPLSRMEFEQYQRKLSGGRVVFSFPQDLYEWYVDINLNKKRGLWVALHQKLIDKMNELSYNINNNT
jgi:hypothetical protein